MIDRDPAIAAVSAQLSSVRLAEQTLPDLLQRIAEAARDVVPGAVEASVLVVGAGGETVLGRTGTVSEQLSEDQVGSIHPRRIESARIELVTEVADMQAETRWPPFAAKAVELGMLSWLALPVPGPLRGARATLDVYSSRPSGLGSAGRAAAEALVREVSVPLANMHALHECQRAQVALRVAMARETLLARAHGVLVGRFGLSVEQAREAVATRASATRTPVDDLATLLVADAERGDFSDADRYRPSAG
ncbi:MAG: hypothetical protein JWQ53_1756 [Klenkia sp.]|nr:hypothetical protein [Klenkia sp.]